MIRRIIFYSIVLIVIAVAVYFFGYIRGKQKAPVYHFKVNANRNFDISDVTDKVKISIELSLDGLSIKYF